MIDLGVVTGFLVASVLARMANRVAGAVVRSEQMLEGFPRWRWALSVFGQSMVFIPLMVLAWKESIQFLYWSDFLVASAQRVGRFERWYVYALFASQTRDMFPMPLGASFMMKLHHWVVVIACCLAFLAPHGFGCFVVGTFVLELGSMFYNLRTLYPKSKAIEVVYQVTMLLSNVAAVWLGFVMLGTPLIPLWAKGLFFAADVGVCIGRQHHALKDAGLLGRKSAEPPAGAGAGGSAAAPTAAAAVRRQRQQRRPGGWASGVRLLLGSMALRKTKGWLAASDVVSLP